MLHNLINLNSEVMHMPQMIKNLNIKINLISLKRKEVPQKEINQKLRKRDYN